MALSDFPDDGSSAPSAQDVITAELDAKSDKWGIGGEMPWVLNLVWRGVKVAIGAVLRGLTDIVTLGATAFGQIIEQDNPALGALATSVIGALFGQSVPFQLPGNILNAGALDQAAAETGTAILTTLFGDALDAEGVE